MASLDVFVSFEYDKDDELKNNFYSQSEIHSRHRLNNHSLNEPYQESVWKGKAKKAIERCDVVVVLIGEDTHNAEGVIVETDMARSLGKCTIQIRPKRRPYKGLTRLKDPIKWRWKTIDAKLDKIAARLR